MAAVEGRLLAGTRATSRAPDTSAIEQRLEAKLRAELAADLLQVLSCCRGRSAHLTAAGCRREFDKRGAPCPHQVAENQQRETQQQVAVRNALLIATSGNPHTHVLLAAALHVAPTAAAAAAAAGCWLLLNRPVSQG